MADALSRALIQESDTVANLGGVITEVIDYTAMARQQSLDAGVERLVTESSLQIVRCQLPDTREQLTVDMSTRKPCPLLPATWTRKIFDINHDLAHAGARAMRRQICDRFVWHGMARDIRQWARTRGLPERESVETHRRATDTTADANQTIRQSARRLGRPIADIARIHLAIDDRRSLHTVAGSHTIE